LPAYTLDVRLEVFGEVPEPFEILAQDIMPEHLGVEVLLGMDLVPGRIFTLDGVVGTLNDEFVGRRCPQVQVILEERTVSRDQEPPGPRGNPLRRVAGSHRLRPISCRHGGAQERGGCSGRPGALHQVHDPSSPFVLFNRPHHRLADIAALGHQVLHGVDDAVPLHILGGQVESQLPPGALRAGPSLKLLDGS